MKVFIVQHVHIFRSRLEDVKIIGIYSSEENAKNAATRLSEQPGFKENIDGFHIDAYELDKDHWQEGYITV